MGALFSLFSSKTKSITEYPGVYDFTQPEGNGYFGGKSKKTYNKKNKTHKQKKAIKCK